MGHHRLEPLERPGDGKLAVEISQGTAQEGAGSESPGGSQTAARIGIRVGDDTPDRVVARIRDADSFAARALGDVQRVVGGSEQIGGATVTEPERGDAERCRDGRCRTGREPCDRPFAGRMCLLGGTAREQQAELVPAEPVHRAVRTRLVRLGRQRSCDGGEGLVATGMAESIVQLLEIVEIAEQHGHVAAARSSLSGAELEPLFERAPVADAGERILECEVGHPGVELGATDGSCDLTRDRLEEPDVTRPETRLGPPCAQPRARPTRTPRA